MKKKVKKLHDIWLGKCDRKSCPIVEYLLDEKIKRVYYCKDCKDFEETDDLDTSGDNICFCNNGVEHRATVYPESGICETFKKKIFLG